LYNIQLLNYESKYIYIFYVYSVCYIYVNIFIFFYVYSVCYIQEADDKDILLHWIFDSGKNKISWYII